MKTKEVATTPSDALKILWKAKFFFKPKSNAEITKRLESMGYNFTQASLGMALLRSKFLTIRGTKSNHLYVQIYPFVEEIAQKPKKAK